MEMNFDFQFIILNISVRHYGDFYWKEMKRNKKWLSVLKKQALIALAKSEDQKRK